MLGIYCGCTLFANHFYTEEDGETNDGLPFKCVLSNISISISITTNNNNQQQQRNQQQQPQRRRQ